MPAKAKFTQEEIVDAALAIVRTEGAKGLTARALGKALGVSSCPIFTAFHGMDEVLEKTLARAQTLYESYLLADMTSGKYPSYKGSGMAYIRFAREEKELFKLLFMRDRTGENIVEERESIRPLLTILQTNLGLTEDEAYRFHLQLWIYVHGVATMAATSYLEWDVDFISRALSEVYEGLRWRYTEGKHEGD